MTRSFLNCTYNACAQKIGPRLLALCLTLIFLSLLANPSAGGRLAEPAAPAAVGENAIWLAGDGYVLAFYNGGAQPPVLTLAVGRAICLAPTTRTHP